MALGPGLVTGAADDDPSGIATYSVAGAQLGTSLLWMAWLTWPLMAMVQMTCARIGMVTGEGLGKALSRKLPRPILTIMCALLFIANTVNIAADLSGMADAMSILTGLRSPWFILLFGISITYAIIKFKYTSIANILKWLALSLMAYVITAVIIHPNWKEIIQQAFSIKFPGQKKIIEMIVAILGTTISPYLFFWQAAQEVEEEKSQGKVSEQQRKGASRREILDRKIDVGAGTFLSNIVMFFIILTTALTLHIHGITQIATSKEVAEALRPLAGNLATLLYTVGVVAVGFLAIPTLSGSAAYAYAEIFRRPRGLDKKLAQAPGFYTIIIVSILLGGTIDFLNINPIKALYWSAIVNGLLAPFLLLAIIFIAKDKKIMNGQPSSTKSLLVVTITTILMFAAAIGMFVA